VAGFPGSHDGRDGEECIGGPSLDAMPEAIHRFEGAGVWGKEVGPLGKYGEEGTLGDVVAEKRSDARTRGE